MEPANPAMPQRGTLRTVEQQVSITPAMRAEAGMKFLADRLRPAHRHAFRQMRIDTAHPGSDRTFDRSIEMHDLLGGMYTGIGAPGTQHAGTLPGDFGERRLQRILHRTAPRLALPAAKARSAIFNAQGNSHNIQTPDKPATQHSTSTLSRNVHGGTTKLTDSGPASARASACSICRQAPDSGGACKFSRTKDRRTTSRSTLNPKRRHDCSSHHRPPLSRWRSCNTNSQANQSSKMSNRTICFTPTSIPSKVGSHHWSSQASPG